MKISAEESLANSMPAVGGTIGGVVGGGSAGPLGAIGGAGLGGMGGAAAKQLLYRLFGFGGPKTTDEAAKGIVVAGSGTPPTSAGAWVRARLLAWFALGLESGTPAGSITADALFADTGNPAMVPETLWPATVGAAVSGRV